MSTDKWPLTVAEIEEHAVKECPTCKGTGIARCVDSECYDFDCPGEFICKCVRTGEPVNTKEE